MAETISWLHLSDLHFGLDSEGWMWPRIKTEIFKDLERLGSSTNGWDLVFFTGDLVQRGEAKEFDALNKELEALWKVLEKFGKTPLLCTVPGNHDLERPSPDSAITKTLSKLWHLDEDLRTKFWKDPTCEYREAIKRHFQSYTNWLSKPPVPMLESQAGILPGDFSSIYRKGSLSLGIIGLNTTFLQISREQGKGSLDLHVSQLNAVSNGDPDNWVKQNTVSILLTHQPMDWLNNLGQDHFKQDIYPPGRFFAHYCGHQHDPDIHELSQAGANSRRLRQAPSLFGLEHYDNGKYERIHGYNSGQFVFDKHTMFERLWPRICIKARHGGLHLAPDYTYALSETGCIVTSVDRPDNLVAEVVTAEVEHIPIGKEISIVESILDEGTALGKLSFCPRLNLKVGPHHQQVRLDEQSECEHELRSSKTVWLVADWGAGHEGFLAAVLNRFRLHDKAPDTFLLKCEEALDIDSFEALFPQQFGVSMQGFCHLVEALANPFLILDGIHPNFTINEALTSLLRILEAIGDYCPSLRVIIVSRMPMSEGCVKNIKLLPLDAPDVRTYVLKHPKSTEEVEDADAIEKLRELSGGLPMHLDRLLNSLSVASLSAIFQSEIEGRSLPDLHEVPQALIHTVSKIASSEDRRTKRSFKLLKVLSVLPYGETLDWLDHYFPTEPFFIDNALQLKEMALLEVVPLQKTDIQSKGINLINEEGNPKLLKVPKQVRDYVQTLLSNEERLDILLAGLTHFCGREWKLGKVKLRSLPIEYREYLGSGAGNEFALIQQLMSYARENSDELLMGKTADLGVRYALHLEDAERFRDLLIVTGSLVQLLDPKAHPSQWSRLSASYGQALRMKGKREDALVQLRAALEAGEETLSTIEKSGIWLDIALAEQKLERDDAAIFAASEALRFSKEGKPSNLHAQVILAELQLRGGQKNKRLLDLEAKARSSGCPSLANTIALEFAYSANNSATKVKHLDRVLKSNDILYNRARAIVCKAEALNSSGGLLNQQDLLSLSWAYSYLHSQRFGILFDQCHSEFWNALERRGSYGQLYRLFRHSSFIWRVRGDAEKELQYLRRLELLNDKGSQGSGRPTIIVTEIRYFMKRLQMVITNIVN